MIKFTQNEQMVTPVPSLFLKKYMVKAPEKYVKMYLFGLYLASSGEQLSELELIEELQQSTHEIEEALNYWASKGLVRATQSGKNVNYEFVLGDPEELKEEDSSAKKEAPLYENRNYNSMLSTLLGRPIAAGELEKIYDFTDVYGLPKDVVIALIEYCVKDRERGSRVSINYIDRVAKSWAEEDITSRERAQEYIESYRAKSGGAARLMRKMGLHGKYPGDAEMEYYEKWTTTWGFTHDAIEYAMRGREFSGSQPFKYLDAILRELYQSGNTSARKINEYYNRREKRLENMKEILVALEYSRINISPKCERFYDEWEQAGVDMPTILLACKQSIKYGSRKLESVDALLKEWRELQLQTEEDIKKHLRKQNTIEKKVKQVFDCAGIDKTVGENEIKNYLKYTKECGMPLDVLLYVAEYSSIKKDPHSYMIAVLNDWVKKDINSLEKAKKQKLDHINIKTEPQAKKDFEQREYSEEEKKQRELESIEELEKLYAK